MLRRACGSASSEPSSSSPAIFADQSCSDSFSWDVACQKYFGSGALGAEVSLHHGVIRRTNDGSTK